MKASPLCLCLLSALVVAGCGRTSYSVRGKVVFADGTPLAGGWVVFERADGTTKASADSPVEADGTFELRTSQPGDGVAPGKYRVLVKPRERPVSEGKKLPRLIHPKYERFETSGIELVVEAKANFFEIKVTKP